MGQLPAAAAAGGGNMSIPANAIVSIRVHNKPVRIAATLSPVNTGMGLFVEGAGDSEADGLYVLTDASSAPVVWTSNNGYTIKYDLDVPEGAGSNPQIIEPSTDVAYQADGVVSSVDAGAIATLNWSDGFEGASPAPVVRQATVNNTGYINSDQWFIRIRLKDNTFEDFIMGEVSNQATWVNTQAGANIAESDLDAVFA